MNDLLADAEREILQKSRSQIEEETAFKWAARSVAAYRRFQLTHLHRWLRDSEHYFEEACEHGALADESGVVLRTVVKWMRRHIPSSG